MCITSPAGIQGQSVDPIRGRTRILYVDHTPIMGGAEISLLELVQTLDRSFFDVAVACTDRCPRLVDMFREAGAEVFCARIPRLKGLASFGALAVGVVGLCKAIRRFKPDIVHSNTVRAHIAGSIAARLCGVRVVWSLRDFSFPSRLYPLLARLADRIMCVSSSIEQAYHLREASGKLSVVLNGIIPPSVDIPTERARIRAEFGIPQHAALATSVGYLGPSKGQDCFLRAASIVRKRVPDARFMVVGDGPSQTYKEKLRELAETEELRGAVTFTGFRLDALSCMCASDVVAHTSTESEAFGRVIIEAMALGVPVIASPDGGPSEIVHDGVSGLLAPPTDTDGLAAAIANVLSDREFGARLSRGGADRFAQLFDQQRETEAVQDVYNSLTGRLRS